MSCPNKEKNKEKCTCGSKDCSRHGVCCECIRFHRDKGGMPGCLRK